MCWTNIRSAFFALLGIQTWKRPGAGDKLLLFGATAVVGLGLGVVLAEGRIGEHAVEAASVRCFRLVLRVGQVSALRMSACEMPCSSMFILQMDQVVPIFPGR